MDVPYLKFADLEAYRNQEASVWVFDLDEYRMRWGNAAALKFWRVPDLDALQRKDFSGDSAQVKTRLEAVYRAGAELRESWTLYPSNHAKTIIADVRPIQSEEGSRAFLIRVVDSGHLSKDPSGLRMLEVARFAPIVLSTFSFEGHLLAQNAAAASIYPEEGQTLQERYRDGDVFESLVAAVREGGSFRADIPVWLGGQPKVHRVLAQRGRDPVSGEHVVFVSEQDITDRVELSQRIETLNQELEERVRQRTIELDQAVQDLRREVDERRSAEARLRENAQFLADIADLASDWFWQTDAQLRFTYVSDKYQEAMGGEPTQLLGRRFDDVHPGSRGALPERGGLEAAANEAESLAHFISEAQTPLGARLIANTAKPIFGSEGQFLGYRGASKDVTDRTQALESLQAREAHLTHAQKMIKLGVAVWDSATERAVYSSESYRELFGLPREGCWRGQAVERVVPEDQARYRQVVAEAQVTKSQYDVRYRIRSERGELRNLREIGEPAVYERGDVSYTICTVQDTTDLDQAAERLRHAQKMESIGQLTGGVAHDFNNILAVIHCSAELMELEVADNEELRASILSASARGADLTHRLLAYARKQPLHARTVDLVTLTEGMRALLQRTLGETIDVVFSTASDVWRVVADPGRVEDALLNLAINARDAMPGGGRLVIETRNVQLSSDQLTDWSDVAPGDYVAIEVTDTGVGMTPEVLSRAFEPFFTTKGVGKGSGLGLSTVYGFARQSGGFVSLSSESGLGTTVALFLPRDESEFRARQEGPLEEAPIGTGQTVLIIEDDDFVRRLTARMVASLGYAVTSVGSARRAHELVEMRSNGFDLIISDIVLPGGTSGPQFLEEVRQRFPDQKIIFMSGYPEQVSEASGFIGSELLLTKPFGREQLAWAIHNVI